MAERVPTGSSILTYPTATWFDFKSPKWSMVHIDDIAHALACITRFAGHTPRPYSVAQHCVLVAQQVPVEFKLDALLHDAHEAYIGDWPRPMKQQLGNQGNDLARRVENVVRRRFGLPKRMSAEVKEADNRMLATEAKSFGFAWWEQVGVEPYPNMEVVPWPWDKARSRFMNAVRKALGDGS